MLANSKCLIPLDVCRLDNWPPPLALGLLQSKQGLGRLLIERADLDTQLREALLALRIGEDTRHGGVERGDNILRRALRHPEPVPERREEAGQPGLVGGWNVRRGR